MPILALDTATAATTVAVVDDDGRPLAERAVVAANRHGELLAGLVAETMAAAGLAGTGLTALAVGVGPGPFTGLRVGVVTGAVLAATWDLPAYPVCSLDAYDARDAVVVTDARRREVYWAAFDRAGARSAGPAVGLPADVPLHGRPAVGPAVELYPDLLPGRPRWPRAALLAATVLGAAVRGDPPAPLVPAYLRRPDATPPGPPKPVTAPAGGRPR